MASCRAADRNSRAWFRVCPCMRRNPLPGVTQPGTLQWLNPDAFVSAVDPSTGACAGGDNPTNCQFGTLGRNALRGPQFFWSDFYLTKSIPLTRARQAAAGRAVLQRVQPSEFRTPQHGFGRDSGKAGYANGVWRAHLHHLSAHRPAGGWFGWRQFPSHDRLSGAHRILRDHVARASRTLKRGHPARAIGESGTLSPQRAKPRATAAVRRAYSRCLNVTSSLTLCYNPFSFCRFD